MHAQGEVRRKRAGPKRLLVRGLITLAPAILTIVVFGLLVQMVDSYVTGPINSAIYWSIEGNAIGWKLLERVGIDPYHKRFLDPSHLPAEFQRFGAQGYSGPTFEAELASHRAEHSAFLRDLEELGIDEDRLRSAVQRIVPPWLGVVLSVLLVLWLGWLMGGYVGRQLITRMDQALHRIPVVNAVYPYSKQLVEFFFAERRLEFDTVVCIPYPSEHLWSLAFVTSSSMRSLREATGKTLVTVFVPSSPMPMTGYTIFVEADRVIPVPLTVDEALRVTMSGGVLIPPRERLRVQPMDDVMEARKEQKA